MEFKKLLQFATLMVLMVACGCETFFYDETYDFYDKAEAATTNQQYDLAEQIYLRLVERNLKSKSEDLMNNYLRLVIIYDTQGRYNEATAMHRRYVELHNESVPSYDKIPLDENAETFLAQGQFDEALKGFQGALKRLKERRRREPNGLNSFPVNNLDYTFRDYYMQTGNYEKAMIYLQARIKYCEQHPADKQDMAEAKKDMAFAYYYMGDDVTAERLFRDAAGLNSSAIIPFEEDLAKSLTMLGKIAEHRGESDKALDFYEKALKVLHPFPNHPGLYRVEKADIWNQVGRFQLTQRKPEESAKAYHEAIALRQATATATHPNCADAYKGLADVAAYTNELTSATLQATKALKILDTALVPTHPRIAPTIVALASLHILSGKPELAAPLNARLETILQKPLGPWKEDFLETTAFYAGLLRKAGQTATAARLEQLHARQKDRR